MILSLLAGLALQLEPASDGESWRRTPAQYLDAVVMDPERLAAEAGLTRHVGHRMTDRFPLFTVRYIDNVAGPALYAFAFSYEVEPCAEESCPVRWRAVIRRYEDARDWQGGLRYERLFNAQLADPDLVSLEDAIAGMPIETLQTDETSCPQLGDAFEGFEAVEALDRAHLRWPLQRLRPASGEPILLHPDMIEVGLHTGYSSATIRGPLTGDRSIVRWSFDLVEAMEPCWRPLD